MMTMNEYAQMNERILDIEEYILTVNWHKPMADGKNKGKSTIYAQLQRIWKFYHHASVKYVSMLIDELEPIRKKIKKNYLNNK